ncbi:ATP-binding protein [Prevotella communis]|uniref:sensor histidine kinase n=1 Tax=Prevotella communis TaxID=2913614 RepID=UPI001EDB2D82|nr:ATP-binding protein [Prevotella communis]UKK61268.1 ATP-binding protein [Prevotella communis]UKK64093.1 ATP-binding protein [Prevotella communis]
MKMKIRLHHLSTRLAFVILLLAAPVFITTIGALFLEARQVIRHKAVGRAKSALNASMQRLDRNLLAVQTATEAYSWVLEEQLHPDSFLTLSHKVVALNPHIDGCSVSGEPFLFPDKGRYYSAYTVREDDSVKTVVEDIYEYFQKSWYKLPHDQDAACWEIFFDETDSLTLTIDGMLASYGRPLHNQDNEVVGIISTDLSLLKITKIINHERPYPNSYFMMLDHDGRYVVHPDTTRLFKKTIFDDADPRTQQDLIALGHQMTAGKEGGMAVYVDGKGYLVCYKPVPGTDWSLAIVCPDNDILKNYYMLTNILVPLLVIGLLIIVLLCYRAVSQSFSSIRELLAKTRMIAEGNLEVYIRRSKRIDDIGRLQNSFAAMLQALQFHIGIVRFITDKLQLRNKELEEATKLAQEANKQKTAFIQNVSHQIRTPLNIVMGFSQVLHDTTGKKEALPEEEMKSIVSTMDHQAKLLHRLISMLFDSSDSGFSEELRTAQFDMVRCNDMARECLEYLKSHYPNIHIELQTEVDDDVCVESNRVYLIRCLSELLYNSAKYSDRQHIVLRIVPTGSAIRFIVEDTGKGISEPYRDLMFKFFTKIDDLSEGLGLGLPLAKRHALNLGGDLWLDDSYQEGCRFVLEIPLKQIEND